MPRPSVTVVIADGIARKCIRFYTYRLLEIFCTSYIALAFGVVLTLLMN